MPIFYNTKTGATAEFTKTEHKGMKPKFKAKWREASESEIALHEKRKGQDKFLSSRNSENEKKAEKVKKQKEALLKGSTSASSNESNEVPAATANSEGSKDKA